MDDILLTLLRKAGLWGTTHSRERSHMCGEPQSTPHSRERSHMLARDATGDAVIMCYSVTIRALIEVERASTRALFTVMSDFQWPFPPLLWRRCEGHIQQRSFRWPSLPARPLAPTPHNVGGTFELDHPYGVIFCPPRPRTQQPHKTLGKKVE